MQDFIEKNNFLLRYFVKKLKLEVHSLHFLLHKNTSSSGFLKHHIHTFSFLMMYNLQTMEKTGPLRCQCLVVTLLNFAFIQFSFVA